MILGTTRAVRVFAYPQPTDLRKGYDGLFGLVKTGLARDPLGGELFLFVNPDLLTYPSRELSGFHGATV